MKKMLFNTEYCGFTIIFAEHQFLLNFMFDESSKSHTFNEVRNWHIVHELCVGLRLIFTVDKLTCISY